MKNQTIQLYILICISALTIMIPIFCYDRQTKALISKYFAWSILLRNYPWRCFHVHSMLRFIIETQANTHARTQKMLSSVSSTIRTVNVQAQWDHQCITLVVPEQMFQWVRHITDKTQTVYIIKRKIVNWFNFTVYSRWIYIIFFIHIVACFELMIFS